MGLPRQEYWSGLPFTSPGDLPNPRTELASSALQADSLPLSHQGSLEQQAVQQGIKVMKAVAGIENSISKGLET